MTRIREVLEDGAGSVRAITANTYAGGLSSVTNANALGIRSMIKPRVESRIIEMRPHPASPPIGGSLVLRSVTVDVRIVRAFTGRHELNDATRDALHAVASTDADVVAQALTWPGNLTATAAAAPTGLVSGCLRYASSSLGTVEADGASDGRIVTTHRFTGIAQIAAATS